jgi:hypothetical protein
MLCGPFDDRQGQATGSVLPPETEFVPKADYNGLHGDGSGWCTEGARQRGLDRARWVRRDAVHGFVDFLHVFQPQMKGVGVSQAGVAFARGVFTVDGDTDAVFRIAWDDDLQVQLNSERVHAGSHPTFAPTEFPVRLHSGENVLLLKLSNTIGLNHGGWAFACQCVLPDGTQILPNTGDEP